MAGTRQRSQGMAMKKPNSLSSSPFTRTLKRDEIKASYGIRVLVEAEHSAANKLEEARERRKLRLREARVDAKHEVEQFRKELEEKFHKLLEQVDANQKKTNAEIEKMTVAELKKLDLQMEQNKEKALQLLEEKLVNIEAHPHQNLKLRERIDSGSYEPQTVHLLKSKKCAYVQPGEDA
uniref:V-type proton ATPase subunit G n=1 Tax=Ditylenchus dipsaci TaxID=166011 RepID=A0A915CZT9_9BILA